MIRIALPVLKITSSTQNYIHALAQCGAEAEAGRVIHPEACDGLLLPGGADIHPSRYGQDVQPQTEPDAELDELQLDVLQKFLDAGKPVFGICRGHQLINVALGGTMIQHLPTAKDHVHIAPDTDNVHFCEAAPDSWISGLYGTRFAVNSSHHQGVGRLGKGLRVSLTAEDGVVEAIEHESLPIWGVQFHPERMCFAHRREDTVDGSLLFRFFLEKI